jgi:hypothetical protein
MQTEALERARKQANKSMVDEQTDNCSELTQVDSKQTQSEHAVGDDKQTQCEQLDSTDQLSSTSHNPSFSSFDMNLSLSMSTMPSQGFERQASVERDGTPELTASADQAAAAGDLTSELEQQG